MTKKTISNTNANFAWQYLKTEKRAFIIAIIFVIINALLQTLTPIAIEYVINNAIKTVNYPLLLQVTLAMCVLFLLEAGIFRYQVITVGHAAQRIMYKIRVNLFAHIQKLKTDFFNENQSGDLISRINSDTTLLDNFLGQYIFSFTSSFFVFIAFAIYLLILNPFLALIAFGGVFLTVIISLIIRPVVEKTNKAGLENNGKLKSYLVDNLNNYQVIQAYNIHTKLSSEFDKFNKDNQKANFYSRFFTNIFNPIYNLAGNLSLLAIIIAIFVLNGNNNSLSIGALVAFIFAVIKFFLPLRELGSVFASLAEAMAALTRIREILDEPTSKVFSTESKNSLINTQLKTAIEFKNVSFTYHNSGQKVFDKVSFSIPTNSKFAIIGPTGEGKSTLAKLMTGLLSESSGSIKIFGEELKEWSQDDFYNSIGFILQDPFLFSGTVASNIVYGNIRYEKYNTSDSITLISDLIKDIESHELDKIIPNLQEFLNTEVNNNSQNISQGQKQIINFIRVLLREPKILILDEATANLDTITEQYLQESLSNLTSKVTQIVIAHRQNTIQDADIVLSVGGGKASVSENI
ncbi:MAG: ABC transporter ATP-binding protein [candidate division SR1 bacterium]|nr:ABC transporter ATP-binding protein [candidate division SR1 bacterium]